MLKEEANKSDKRKKAKESIAMGGKRKEMIALIAGTQSTSTLRDEEGEVSVRFDPKNDYTDNGYTDDAKKLDAEVSV